VSSLRFATSHRRLSAALEPTNRGRRQMMTHTAKGTSQDRRLIAGSQDHEVRYEPKRTGSAKKDVKQAINKVGNSRRNVEKELD
jgi:hypothetical protein